MYSDTDLGCPLDFKLRTEDNNKKALCRKPRDRRQFLHDKSCHSIQNKRGTPYSRLRRLCSEKKAFGKKDRTLREVFINRRYLSHLVNNSNR